MKHINKRILHDSILIVPAKPTHNGNIINTGRDTYSGIFVYPKELHPNDRDYRTYVPTYREQVKLLRRYYSK